MYKVIWVRDRKRFKDKLCEKLVTPEGNNTGAKNYIAWMLHKEISDLRFTPISLMGEPAEAHEWVVDFYGLVVACITVPRAYEEDYGR